ncbi:DUF4236 domain-containing protein [Bradyrhizobium sp. Ec3.3]|uniref:DUF4236 domain-containing protein n=1 Tax=Bradyrhizobium sp. Ec3.3 TaxID=189753 RepID=UPI0003F9FBFC|nr:DUF4236 domain-containing protein [Bradyrhizobium sp. Ec3.3]
MGFFRFRQSFKIIQGVRLNLSGSGASVSLGVRDAHFTIGPHGTRTTVGLPGSGISWTAYQAYSSANRTSLPNGALPNPGPNEATSLDRSATVISSAPIEQLVASSTIDIAEALNASRSRWQLYKALIGVLVALFAVGALSIVSSPPVASPIAVLVTAGAAIILGAIAVHGLQSNTISLHYDLSSDAAEHFEALGRAFGALSACSRIWRIPLERAEADWKRNAGVSKTVERKLISLRRATPSLVKCNVEFLQVTLGNQTIYFTPDAILVIAGARVAAFRYNDVEIVSRATRFIEDGAAPSDAHVVAETWRFVNRNGGPDRRFSNNRKLPICLYGEIDFKSASGLNERIHCTRVDASEGFASAVIAMRADYPAASVTPDNSHTPPLTFAPQQARGAATVEVGEAYAHETEAARAFAMNHGKLWEFLLVEELLRSKLQPLEIECDKLASIVPRKLFTGREFFRWVGSECSELSSAIASIKACIDKDLMDALGQPGMNGNAIAILSAVNSLFHNCRRFLEFETDLCAAEVPSAFYELKDSFRGIAASMVRVIDDLYLQWSRNTEALRNGAQKFELKITFDALPQLKPALAEFERIRKRPELY